MAAMPFTRPRHWLRWLLIAIAGLVVLAAAGPFVYIHFFNSTPAALSLSPGNTTTGTRPARAPAKAPAPREAPAPGRWPELDRRVRLHRRLPRQRGAARPERTAVGRTSEVTGHLTIAGSAIVAAAFTVPMATVHSDKSQRDAQFDGRIMDVAVPPGSSP